MSCDEPVALFRPMRESIIVRVSFGSCVHVCEVNFIVGCIVRVRCRGKKFTFAISSSDEFLVMYMKTGHKILTEKFTKNFSCTILPFSCYVIYSQNNFLL